MQPSLYSVVDGVTRYLLLGLTAVSALLSSIWPRITASDAIVLGYRRGYLACTFLKGLAVLKGTCCAIHRDFELLRHSKQGCRDLSVRGNHNHIAQLRTSYGVPGNIVQIPKQQVQQT
jgi:hypothetical protein